MTDDVAELRKLLDAATPGPWFTLDPPWLPGGAETSILAESPDPHVARFICDFDLCMMDDDDRKSENPDADAALIVAAVNALPSLLDRLTAAEAENAAIADVAFERNRQVTEEGWTPEGDDTHFNGELAMAAAAYAYFHSEIPAAAMLANSLWPWHKDWWKPGVDKDPESDWSGRRRNLVKAGALIVAEIERLDRAALATEQAGKE